MPAELPSPLAISSATRLAALTMASASRSITPDSLRSASTTVTSPISPSWRMKARCADEDGS